MPAATAELIVPEHHAGARLDVVVAALVEGLSRSQAQRLIKDGCVRVDGQEVTRSSEPVEGGARLLVDRPAPVPSTLSPEALPLGILYDDDDMAVIDKPAGLVVHPGAGHDAGTLVNALLHHIPNLSGVGGERRPGIVHRLDKGTSGVMIVAKNDFAHQALARQFSAREVQKAYVVLVWGALAAGRRIDAAIGRDPHDRQRMSVRARRSRDALTEVLEAEPLRGVTLARVSIATGRTHQIRVHLQSIGHPVVGDPVYGGIRRPLPLDLRVLASLERPFLHAARIALRHPRDGRALAFEAPLPADLQEVLRVLRQRRTAKASAFAKAPADKSAGRNRCAKMRAT
jgi:23S rRNA pseudouridine1911/1915/1917 synthase